LRDDKSSSRPKTPARGSAPGGERFANIQAGYAPGGIESGQDCRQENGCRGYCKNPPVDAGWLSKIERLRGKVVERKQGSVAAASSELSSNN
jgi:hypothetical protein